MHLSPQLSNARQMPGVRECLERDLLVAPKELVPHLKEILEASDPSRQQEEPSTEPAPPPGPK